MVQPEDIRAEDQDEGLNSPIFYSFAGAEDEYRYFELNKNTGHIYLRAAVPETEINRCQ